MKSRLSKICIQERDLSLDKISAKKLLPKGILFVVAAIEIYCEKIKNLKV